MGNWAILDIEYFTTSTGFNIVVTTNLECFLYCRMTTVVPVKHKEALLVRGYPTKDDTRFCFVAWEDNPQVELGETLIHTFHKPDWPVCETRYFYFHGIQGGDVSPSVSAYFPLHKTEEVIPSSLLNIPADANNRSIFKSAITWPPVHDALSGAVQTSHSAPFYIIRAETLLTTTYQISRGYLRFWLTGIPAGSTFTAAKLDLWPHTILRTSSAIYPHIQLTQGIQSDPIISTDYGAQLPLTDVGGQIDLGDMILAQYNELWFNDTGLSWLTPDAYNRFCTRQEMDLENQTPPLGANQLFFNSQQAPAGTRPLLSVWYVPP